MGLIDGVWRRTRLFWGNVETEGGAMEEHMKINKVGSEQMVPYAIKYLVEEAATWWRMHQAIDESQRMISWKEFTKILLGSRLVTPTQRTVNLKRPRACKICGEARH